MKIKTKDEIVHAVLKKIDERSLKGQAKYGAMMMEEVDGEDKDLMDFLIDVQEEIMDALLYIEAAKRCIDKLKKPAYATALVGNRHSNYEGKLH
tara:strand:- start:5863 stop:6144 length:282 start_codon:yes stop_codon:yes gene_type:complete